MIFLLSWNIPFMQLKALEDVEFWRDPEKTGWMQCQGEVIKSWRRRWFILKEGFLFRFSSPDVNAASKPRGFVDLSKVTDVSEARDQTGKNNSLKLSTETGHVAYLADSETELVEWISALEGAVSAIVRKVNIFPSPTRFQNIPCIVIPDFSHAYLTASDSALGIQITNQNLTSAWRTWSAFLVCFQSKFSIHESLCL